MKITKIRKNSEGLKGTIRNAMHHAKSALPIIKSMVKIIESKSYHITEWKQGHNVHTIEAKDGRVLHLRPFLAHGIWGVEVSIKVNKVSYTLAQIRSVSEVKTFDTLLNAFLTVEENVYGKKIELPMVA